MRCEITGLDDGTQAGVEYVRCTFRPGPPPGGGPTPLEEHCVSGNRAVLAAAQAVGDSMVTISYNSAGICTSIAIDASSEYAPKTP